MLGDLLLVLVVVALFGLLSWAITNSGPELRISPEGRIRFVPRRKVRR